MENSVPPQPRFEAFVMTGDRVLKLSKTQQGSILPKQRKVGSGLYTDINVAIVSQVNRMNVKCLRIFLLLLHCFRYNFCSKFLNLDLVEVIGSCFANCLSKYCFDCSGGQPEAPQLSQP